MMPAVLWAQLIVAVVGVIANAWAFVDTALAYAQIRATKVNGTTRPLSTGDLVQETTRLGTSLCVLLIATWFASRGSLPTRTAGFYLYIAISCFTAAGSLHSAWTRRQVQAQTRRRPDYHPLA